MQSNLRLVATILQVTELGNPQSKQNRVSLRYGVVQEFTNLCTSVRNDFSKAVVSWVRRVALRREITAAWIYKLRQLFGDFSSDAKVKVGQAYC